MTAAVQERLIERVRRLAAGDERIAAALMYGRGEFHFEPMSAIGQLRRWRTTWLASLEHAVLHDETGALTEAVRPLVGERPRLDEVETASFLVAGLLNLAARYQAVAATAKAPAPRRRYAESWRWSRELIDALACRYGIDVPAGVAAHLDARLLDA